MRQLQSAEKMPGQIDLPILNDVKFIASQGYSLTEQWRRQGSMFKTNFVMKKFAVLISPDANRLMLHEQADRLSSYLSRRFLIEPIFGRPIMMQEGQEHRQTRQLLCPSSQRR